METQTTKWLKGLAAKGGKGVVNNIDARSLGRIAEHIERLEEFQLRVFCLVPSQAPLGFEHTDEFKVKIYNALREYIAETFLKEAIP